MPDWKNEVRTYLAAAKLGPELESDVAEELAQHLNDRYHELIAAGSTLDQAQQAVLQELREGKLAAALDAVLGPAIPAIPPGSSEAGSVVGGVARDLRYALRVLRMNPGFTVVAVLSLALGIGANTAIFQLLDAVRLRTLPVKDPEQIADIRVTHAPNGRTGSFRGRAPMLTTALWQQVRAHQQGFTDVAAWGSLRANFHQGGEAKYGDVLYASGNLFDLIGVPPLLGRVILPADDSPECNSAGAVVSYSYWQRELGGRSPLGEIVRVEGHPFEVIGVTPPYFFGLEVGHTFEVAVPLCAEKIISTQSPLLNNPQGWWLAAVGRLKSGWTLERATAQLEAISPAIFQTTLPAAYDATDRKDYLAMKLEARPGGAGVSELRRDYGSSLWVLQAISGLVLLIACANLANLMLARASARQREMAIRLAIGASRGRLIRQLLSESFLIACLGAASGVVLAQLLSKALVGFLATEHSRIFIDLQLDWNVLAFTAGLAIVTCLIFGLTPAIQASGIAPAEAMKAGGRGLTSGRESFGLQRGMVVSQVALSLVLIVGAFLFVRTLRNLMTLDAGFQQNHILVADLDLTALKVPVANLIPFKRELRERMQAIPGVTSVAETRILPLSGDGWNDRIATQDRKQSGHSVATFNRVSPGYFKTVGTPLLAGRDFNQNDTRSSPQVAIVTETFARKFMDGINPIGRTFGAVQQEGKPDRLYQIVGLVKDSKYQDLREDFTPLAFLDADQADDPDPEAQLVVYSNQSLENLATAVRRTAAEINPAIVLQFTVFQTMVRDRLVRERLMATLSGFFGGLAALLAMIGLYGVISYMVVRRRNEIGIRMALGADRRSILSLIMGEAATLLGFGLVVGIVLSLAATTAAKALLFGMKPGDPLTLLVATISLAVVAAVASFWPAHRAAHLDPMIALRDE